MLNMLLSSPSAAPLKLKRGLSYILKLKEGLGRGGVERGGVGGASTSPTGRAAGVAFLLPGEDGWVAGGARRMIEAEDEACKSREARDMG
jgi:hypothetical protein